MNFFDDTQTIHAARCFWATGRPGKHYDQELGVRISSRGRLIAFRTAVSGAEKGLLSYFDVTKLGDGTDI